MITATSNCAVRAKGPISPGWFIPISINAKSVSLGILAKVRGTPQWLLKLRTAAWTLPCTCSAARSISFVPVLPTDPVTPITLAFVLVRAAKPSATNPSNTSGTTNKGASLDTPSGRRETNAAPAPICNAVLTKSCPSRTSFKATNKSPCSNSRVSIEIPPTHHSP